MSDWTFDLLAKQKKEDDAIEATEEFFKGKTYTEREYIDKAIEELKKRKVWG